MKQTARPYYRSSSFKMAALFTLLLGVSALLLGYYLYDFGRQNFIQESEAAIDMEMQHSLNEVAGLSQQARTAYIQRKSAATAHSVYFLQDASETKHAGNIEMLPDEVERLGLGVIGFKLKIDGETRQMAAKIHTFSDGARLLIGRDITKIMQSRDQLKLITALVFGFMLLVVAVSFFISMFVVGRINTIAQTARTIIETGDLSQRIEVEGSWDDLSNLAQILNSLLAQIESLMQGIRDVGDSIAHDLRTPLTRLRNQLETMEQGSAEPHAVSLALAEADGLLNTFQALLRIANIEKGKRYQAFEEIDLVSIVQDVVELYEPLAEEKTVALDVSLLKAAAYRGDRDLLFQACANLLDNAIKFSPEGSRIHLQLNHVGDGWELQLADKGCGVSEAERERLFDRFYRADSSRHRAGSGLGLSLVKAVMDLHKADIALEDNMPGLRVVIRF